MTSLRNIVILVVGDPNVDAVVPCWTAPNIENWLRQHGIKQVFEISKSVTHVVCSRAAYEDNVPEVKFVKSIKGWNRESRRGVPRLVTYDWLEDTLDDKKPMKHFWAYHPGKPRDIEAMLDGRRKAPKKPRATKAIEVGAEEVPEDLDTSASKKVVNASSAKNKNSSKPTGEENAKPAEKQTADSKHAVENLDTNKDGKPLGAALHVSKSTAQGRTESSPNDKTANARKQTTEVTSTEKDPIPIVDNRPWETRVQARLFHDKDKFPYHVELTREKDGLRWVLAVLESTSPPQAPKAYRFRALQYSARGDRILLAERRDPVSSPRAALACLAAFFRARTGYAWDERLLRAARGEHQPLWQYRAPAAGAPTGSVPPAYTPGHPDCVGELSPIVGGCGPARAVGKTRQERSRSEGPLRCPKTDKNAQWKMLMEKRGQSSQKKRKTDEAVDPERRSQLPKKRKPGCYLGPAKQDKVLKSSLPMYSTKPDSPGPTDANGSIIR